VAKNSYQSNYYSDIIIHKCDIDNILVLKFQQQILEKETNETILSWYRQLKDKELEWFLIATLNGNPISGCGYGHTKVLRYLYTFKEYRNKYRGLAQIDYVPLFVKITNEKRLFLSIDAYDKTHEKLAKAWDRVILSGIPPEKQPYRAKWKYIGVYKYKNIDQHFYELNLNDNRSG
tara:strand:- start:238 stop:765 length:528 start_codon:yes stop_codon:yes gene_type:complete